MTELASFFAYDPAFRRRRDVACGDVTGDGVADVITGAGGRRAARAGVQLAGGVSTEVASFFAYDPAFTGGVHVAAGDLTGDGVAEIITGAGPGGGPHVRVVQSDGRRARRSVASFFAYDPAFTGGVHVAAARLTGDGVAEIITGAGPGGGPHVRVFSRAGGGVDGGRAASSPTTRRSAAGWRGGRGRDRRRRGRDHHRAPGRAAGRTCGSSVSRAASLTEVAELLRLRPGVPGGVHVAAGDVDGDGGADIITGAGPGGGPHVRAFSLAGGGSRSVASFFAYDPAFPGGVHVAAADLNRLAPAVCLVSIPG